MRILESDISWIADIRLDVDDFASQLNGTKTKCDCCSLMKWDDFQQGVIQVAAQSAATKLAKLKSLMEDQIEAQSKL
jgi:hypothetical protein|tara:strand:+ start:253 stop:483 length:231 start_codon:yes stop_codon:yes gene_type:complete